MVSLFDAAYGYSLLTKLISGSFTVLFIAALWVIFQKRSGINMNLLSTVIIIWILATVVSSPAFPRLLIVLFISQHLILDIVRAVEAFVDADGTALDYYSNLSNPLQAAKTAIYVILTLVGDGFAVSRCILHLLASHAHIKIPQIYRCYVVWNRKWYIIPGPLLLLCGTGGEYP